MRGLKINPLNFILNTILFILIYIILYWCIYKYPSVSIAFQSLIVGFAGGAFLGLLSAIIQEEVGTGRCMLALIAILISLFLYSRLKTQRRFIQVLWPILVTSFIFPWGFFWAEHFDPRNYFSFATKYLSKTTLTPNFQEMVIGPLILIPIMLFLVYLFRFVSAKLLKKLSYRY